MDWAAGRKGAGGGGLAPARDAAAVFASGRPRLRVALFTRCDVPGGVRLRAADAAVCTVVDMSCVDKASAAAVAQHRDIQLNSVTATLEGGMNIQGILGMDPDIRSGFDGIKVSYKIDADADREDIEALVAQSQKLSAVYDIIANPTNITVEVE